ncbi:MAG: class I SAM-dependent methyltransferase [bacterium]|nr:class I SAM-dependent methyltransferase [bacterium]
MKQITIEFPKDWTEYELLDSGDGKKLERFGPYRVVRPDPRILWKRNRPEKDWNEADASFIRSDQTTGRWEMRRNIPNSWTVRHGRTVFNLKPTEFKHLGVFPEQASNWNWIQDKIRNNPLKILNLFAYTGGATLEAAQNGGIVTHVDSVRSTIAWAKENARSSGLSAAPIRWIEDDAYKFVLREGRRNSLYDGVIMDPPRFGRGAKGEVWKLEEDLPRLLAAIRAILVPHPRFLLINAYTADVSSIVLRQLLTDALETDEGTIESGELALKESSSDRLLPSGIFARWSSRITTD